MTEQPVETNPLRASSSDSIATAAAVAFDPLGLEMDIELAPVKYRDSIAAGELNGGVLGSASPFSDTTAVGLTRDSSEAYDTYRIQLFNSLTFSEATQERKIAQEIFDYQTSLDYEVPYFKVRIGDFTDYKSAEKYLRDFVKPAGYPNSWVVRVRVLPVRDNSFTMALELFFDSLRAEIEAEDDLLQDSLATADTVGLDTTMDENSDE